MSAHCSAIAIVDEQDDFIVVVKPSGIGFHDEAEHGSGLFSQVKNLFGFKQLYPVHRLDKMTSGLIIFAKNLACAQSFQLLFELHQVEKYYLALSDKKPKKKQGLIKGDMAKSRRGAWKLLRSSDNPAISQFFSYGVHKGVRLFVVKPHSGKTHQIRVALNSVGSPIIGDGTYHPNANNDRGYLHAYALKFTYLGEQFEFTSPPTTGEYYLTSEIVEQLSALKKAWQLNWPRL